jgi:hypothetical protein
VHEPQDIQQEISRRQDRASMLKQDSEAQRQKQAIVEYLSVYHETVGSGAGVTAQANGQAANESVQTTVGEHPPKVRDRSRPPGIPLVRRDTPPGT